MNKTNLPINPQEVTKAVLKKLPSRRMRDVIEKRFGLKGGRFHTLEAVGKEYKITRERVRQIEADALKHLRNPENLAEVKPLLVSVTEHLKTHGEVMAEHHLFGSLAAESQHPHLALLLEIGDGFHKAIETDEHHARWTLNFDSSEQVEKIMSNVIKALEHEQKPVSKDVLHSLVAANAKEVLGSSIPTQMVEAFLATSKIIGFNPYGEYGLLSWPSINPRGVKDKAYVALQRNSKPMHFLEIAEAINKAGWSKRKAHPQTVHNELIKDNRFVLVGRGLYALKEWGYEPGVVRDVLTSILRKAGKPLSKEEIIKEVAAKRMVKAPTILLNLQNRSFFKKNEDGKFTLV